MPEPTSTKPTRAYADYDGDGGWGYRRYDDGSIKVIKAPEGHKAGAHLSGGAPYDAIMREISTKTPTHTNSPGSVSPFGPTATGMVGGGRPLPDTLGAAPSRTPMAHLREAAAQRATAKSAFPGAQVVRGEGGFTYAILPDGRYQIQDAPDAYAFAIGRVESPDSEAGAAIKAELEGKGYGTPPAAPAASAASAGSAPQGATPSGDWSNAVMPELPPPEASASPPAAPEPAGFADRAPPPTTVGGNAFGKLWGWMGAIPKEELAAAAKDPGNATDTELLAVMSSPIYRARPEGKAAGEELARRRAGGR